jgi:hypothetical protein
MALIKGDITASDGMAKTIYDKLQEVFLPAATASGVDMAKLQETWQKLAYAIASGVIDHLTANTEITGIKTKWKDDESTKIYGQTTSGDHSHNVVVNGSHAGVEFAQSNDGLHHVK